LAIDKLLGLIIVMDEIDSVITVHTY